MDRKELRKLIREVEAQGFTVRVTSKGHFFVTKNGQPVTTISGTASDHRSHANSIGQLRRAGFIW